MEQQVAALQQQVGQLVQTLQGQQQMTQQLQQQLQQQAQAATAAQQAVRSVGIDTKLLGRPDIFEKEEKWMDWSTIMRAYGGLLGEKVGPGMRAAETGGAVLNASLDAEERRMSLQLHYALTMLCRGEALSIVQNAGAGEGFHAWQKLSARYEPTTRTRLAGALAALMRFSFAGDIQARLELFERSILAWEQKAGETLSANIRIGILLNCLDEGSALREHLILNSSRFTTWQEVKDEVVNIRRTQLAFRTDDPMDVGALEGKGGKSKGKGGETRSCNNCGRPGHIRRDCRAPGGGAHRPAGSAGAGKGAGKGKGKDGARCFNCGGKGHLAAQCPSPRINALDEGNEEVPTWTQQQAHDGGHEQQHQQQLEAELGGLFLCPLDIAGIEGDRQKDRTLRIGVDSCAAASVLPTGSCTEYPVVRDGVTGAKYRAANGAVILDEGERTIYGAFDGHAGVRGARFRVADVSRPLMAIADMLDQGHRIVFDRDDCGQNVSVIVNKKTGKKLPIKERNRTFEIEMRLAPRPFGRPGQGP